MPFKSRAPVKMEIEAEKSSGGYTQEIGRAHV